MTICVEWTQRGIRGCSARLVMTVSVTWNQISTLNFNTSVVMKIGAVTTVGVSWNQNGIHAVKCHNRRCIMEPEWHSWLYSVTTVGVLWNQNGIHGCKVSQPSVYHGTRMAFMAVKCHNRRCIMEPEWHSWL